MISFTWQGPTFGANTFTATQTITPEANTSAITISGVSGTGANAFTMLSVTGTWNTSGIMNGITVDVTNTASSGSSTLLNLRVGGTSQFSVLTSGVTTSRARVVSGAAVAATAAGAQVLSFGALSLYVSTGVPTVAAPKGSVCLNVNGSTTNDRAFVATDAVGGWTAIITAT